MAPAPRVVKSKPDRGVDGRVQRLAQLRFTRQGDEITAGPGVTAVPVIGELLSGAAAGDELELRDTRDRRRRFTVHAVRDDGSVDATCDRTSYVATDLPVQRRRDDEVVATGTVGPMPPTDPFIWLYRGDRLRIERGLAVARTARRAVDGSLIEPPAVGCELESVFDSIAVGDAS